MTVNKLFSLNPSSGDFSYRCDFGGQQQHPFCAGLRSESEWRTALLMASAPLPSTLSAYRRPAHSVNGSDSKRKNECAVLSEIEEDSIKNVF
jgi:hypothetical protein